MNKKIITIAMLGVLVSFGAAHAQTIDLLNPGALPGSPFYFVKSFFENVGTFFTFGNSAKAERYLGLAEKRLAEAEALAAQDDERAQSAVARYEEQYAKAKEYAERTANPDLKAQVADATTKHLSVLDKVLNKVPEQAKESVRTAKERSISGQIEVLRDIAPQDPEAVVDIFTRAAEGRLNAVQAQVGHSGDNEEKAEEVSEVLAEYEKYAEFGKEISTLTEGLQTGETTVEELVEQATSHHRDVLRDVENKAPSQARESIQRVLERTYAPGTGPGEAGNEERLAPGTNDDSPENTVVGDEGGKTDVVTKDMTIDKGPVDSGNGGGGDGSICCKKIINGKVQYHWDPEDVCLDPESVAGIVVYNDFCLALGDAINEEDDVITEGVPEECASQGVYDKESCSEIMKKVPICCKHTINGEIKYEWTPGDICVSPDRERVSEDLCSQQ